MQFAFNPSNSLVSFPRGANCVSHTIALNRFISIPSDAVRNHDLQVRQCPPTTNPHFTSMKPTNDLILASRIYVAVTVLVFVYLVSLRLLERCALTATTLLVYRTFPPQTAACFHVLFLAFRTALWITVVDYLGEENARPYYESDLAGLLRLRFCNCLRSGVYFTRREEEEAFACTDGYRARTSLRARRVEGLRFGVSGGRGAVAEIGPLNDYVNMLRAAAGKGVAILYDEESAFDEECQRVFKEVL